MPSLDDDKTAQDTVEFLNMYSEAINEAEKLVIARGAEGRNGVVSLPDMFLRDPGKAAFMIYMKIARVLGECEDKNFQKAREEFLDIINYAGFGIALIDDLER